MRSAATAAMSSEIRNGRHEASRYGSNTSAYSSHAASRPARPARSASRSGSSPTSGSQLPGRMTSRLAPSWAPASRTCATSSSSSDTVSSPPPAASAATPSTKFLTLAAISSASGRHPPSWPCGSDGSDIKQSPSLERAAERHLVGVLQVTPHRQAAGRPGHPDAHRLDQPGDEGGRRLALEVGIGGQDQLGHGAVGQPRHEFLDAQLVGADAVDGTDRPAQHVVAAAVLADLLHGRDVLRLLHHADHRRVAPRVTADPALL